MAASLIPRWFRAPAASALFGPGLRRLRILLAEAFGASRRFRTPAASARFPRMCIDTQNLGNAIPSHLAEDQSRTRMRQRQSGKRRLLPVTSKGIRARSYDLNALEFAPPNRATCTLRRASKRQGKRARSQARSWSADAADFRGSLSRAGAFQILGWLLQVQFVRALARL